MFLTDFRMRKYTGGIISRVGIFLTVTMGKIYRQQVLPWQKMPTATFSQPYMYHIYVYEQD